jgi:glutamate-5-semialdehyde dehydrogenase
MTIKKTLKNENDLLISEFADRARVASPTLRSSSYLQRQSALLAIADSLEKRSDEIIEANMRDLTEARATSTPESLLDRLMLNKLRIEAIAGGARKVAALPDPLNRVLSQRTLENGLHLQQVSMPFGVVGMVYEARPNVTVDAALILLISGNSALLRGSSSAQQSNLKLIEIMRDVLEATSISPDVIQLLPSHDRDTVRALLHARGKVDLVIPRGSADLIRFVVDEALVPTIETGAGVCHVYVDESADLEKAMPILLNSKIQRPSVCNAAETLLVHRSLEENFLPEALRELGAAGVRLHCDAATQKLAQKLGIDSSLAQEENWSTEYGVLEMNVAIVDSLEAAIEHIAKYGTQHTEAIITESSLAAEKFISLSDCAAVMVNASTRFTDGEEMGFGAEIGISNQKLHARGPMGLEEMTTTRWIVKGSGQTRL